MEKKSSGPLMQIPPEAELLVSGGFIFGLINLSNKIPVIKHFAVFNYTGLIQKYAFALDILGFAMQVLAFGFLLNIIARMIWLSFNGLAKKYPENYGSYYGKGALNKLTNQSFIELKGKFDHAAGLIFAISTSLLGLLVSFYLWVCVLITLGQGDLLTRKVAIVIWFLYLLISLPYFVNFITFHQLSKTRFYKWYRPINQFLSVLTLSIVYRKLYMGVIANVRNSWLLISITLLVFFSAYRTNLFEIRNLVQSDKLTFTSHLSDYRSVDASMYTENMLVYEIPPLIQISSYTVQEDVLVVRLLHFVNAEELIHNNLLYDSLNYKTMALNTKLEHVSNFYNVYIDEEKQQLRTHSEKHNGYTYLKFILNTAELDEGEHRIKVTLDEPVGNTEFRTPKDEIHENEYSYVELPFYKIANESKNEPTIISDEGQ